MKLNTWTFDKVYPLADSLLVQCPLNVEGKNGHRMTIQTLSGKSMKTFPSLNNAAVDISAFFLLYNNP